MTDIFRGLHHQDQHLVMGSLGVSCQRCDSDECRFDDPCRCCLVEEVKVLRAQVQRVREVCDGIEPDHSVFVGDVLDALNGGDDE